MRTWVRVACASRCGCCGRTIYVGQPMLVLKIAALSLGRTFRRCQDCAGEPVPADLPALPLRDPTPAPMVGLRAVAEGSLPLDYKVRQTKDD